MRKERRSRIGSYAISSSMSTRDHRQQPCITYQNSRESDYRAYWLVRNQRILDSLLRERSSIICLQEFWLGNEELVNMYEKRLGDAGYLNFSLHEPTTVVMVGLFRVINHRELLFNDCGDRVAQLLHVELAAPCSPCRNNDTRQEILIVNTHLLFPHDSSLSLVRLNQVYKILQYVESYQKENKLSPTPIMLCGDWNGSKRGHVYKFLRSQGFVSSYDTAHQYTDADAHKWVSHLNHRGNICGVDFIWLLNPNRYRKLLKTSWSEAVFGMFKYLLRRASLTEKDAFAFLKADSDSDWITYSGFCEALQQLNLTGHCNGLSDEETKDLWVQADIDGMAFLIIKNFRCSHGGILELQQRIWNPTWSEQKDDVIQDDSPKGREEQTIGFSVENAVLFPPEVEKGMWPENYSLSDHARLTVVFSPIRMPCSQLIS
ncbi:calcium-binding protein [Salix suchowensis]|nr:calcium-binding protein [Salix suchowensis]